MELVERIRHRCREEKEAISAHLVGGGVPDYAAYSKAVGAVQALEMVLSEIDEIEQKYIEQ